VNFPKTNETLISQNPARPVWNRVKPL